MVTVGSDDRLAAVRPNPSAAVRAACRSASDPVTTNEPAGNSMPSAVNGFSTIFIVAFRTL